MVDGETLYSRGKTTPIPLRGLMERVHKAQLQIANSIRKSR